MAKKKLKPHYRRRPLKEYCSRKNIHKIKTEHQLDEFEDRINALEMRKGGASYSIIAKELVCSPSRAAALVKKSLTEIYDLESQYAKELRELELQRLDSLLAALWKNALKGDLPTVDRVLKIIDTRAKMSGLLQAITNNVFNIQTNNDNRQLTVVEIQKKRKELEHKISLMRRAVVKEKGEK